MHREQYGEYGYWCQGVFTTWFSFMHLCFRKATSVKKEESSKAKKNRRPISLDSGKEMMCTYWGCTILFMWRGIGRFYLHRNHDNIFLNFFFLNFIGLTALLTGQKVWKYEFGIIFLIFLVLFIFKMWPSWISCECEKILDINFFIMHEKALYFYVTEFYKRVSGTLLIDGVWWLDRENTLCEVSLR